MKTLKAVSVVSAVVGFAAVLLSPTAMSAGKGWDTFNIGQGERIPSASQDHRSAPRGAAAGKGWDTFNMGQGERIPSAARDHKSAPAGASAGKGWDTFNMGQGERIPAGDPSYKGAASDAAGLRAGWDVFYTGERGKL